MSMLQYEDRRENLWRDAYKGDPAFPYDDTPIAKVTNFFCKRKPNDPEINLTNEKKVDKDLDFDLELNVEWVDYNLNRTLQYKRKWYGDKDIYQFVALVNYIEQCKGGGYKRCILSKQEYMMIKPNKK